MPSLRPPPPPVPGVTCCVASEVPRRVLAATSGRPCPKRALSLMNARRPLSSAAGGPARLDPGFLHTQPRGSPLGDAAGAVASPLRESEAPTAPAAAHGLQPGPSAARRPGGPRPLPRCSQAAVAPLPPPGAQPGLGPRCWLRSGLQTRPPLPCCPGPGRCGACPPQGRRWAPLLSGSDAVGKGSEGAACPHSVPGPREGGRRGEGRGGALRPAQ